MAKDPDLERDLERLMTRVDLPEHDRWVPVSADRHRAPWSLITGGAVAAALLLTLAIGVVGFTDVGFPGASRRPLQTLPTFVRPTPTASTPPRGTAVAGPVGTVLDFAEDAGSMAADDHAFAAVVADAASSRIVVTEIGRQKHVVEVTRGRVPFISPHGALRGNLVAYTETEAKDVSADAPVVVWHVMVGNWRTGTVTELDAIPGKESIAPHSPDYRPNVYTNGRDVIWLRTPQAASGQLGDSELVLWRNGLTNIIWRSDWRSELSYALADDGRIAVVQLACPPGARLGFCPTGTRWELYVMGSNFTPTLVSWRDAFGDRGGVGGPPSFAANRIVWPRVSKDPVNVTAVDVVDPGNGDVRTVTDEACSWIGSTVRDVVFGCQNGILHIYPVTDAITRIESTEAGTSYIVADPHAIIGRRVDGAWLIRPVPD
jgi:hypothetical protein